MDEREWNFYRAMKTTQNSILAIRAGGRGDVTESRVLWRYRKSLPNVPSPLLYRRCHLHGEGRWRRDHVESEDGRNVSSRRG